MKVTLQRPEHAVLVAGLGQKLLEATGIESIDFVVVMVRIAATTFTAATFASAA